MALFLIKAEELEEEDPTMHMVWRIQVPCGLRVDGQIRCAGREIAQTISNPLPGSIHAVCEARNSENKFQTAPR